MTGERNFHGGDVTRGDLFEFCGTCISIRGSRLWPVLTSTPMIPTHDQLKAYQPSLPVISTYPYSKLNPPHSSRKAYALRADTAYSSYNEVSKQRPC